MPSSQLHGPTINCDTLASRAREPFRRSQSVLRKSSNANKEAGLLAPPTKSAPTAETRRGLRLKALTVPVFAGALIPTAVFVALLAEGTIQIANLGTDAS